MAILYGTQSNGETLPVLVDQFGNLLAKGIEGETGPPGPEGPPGVGQLPPNPYEGAILGWEDGQLAWLGGSVPLPAGTYGPYTYQSGNEQLDIPQDASALVNGQQLFMSDASGQRMYVGFQTDTISNVGVAPAWNQAQIWSNSLKAAGGFLGGRGPTGAFDGDLNDYAASNSGGQVITFTSPIAFPADSSLEIIGGGGTHLATVNGGPDQTVPSGTSFTPLTYTAGSESAFIITIRAAGGNNTNLTAIKINGRILVDTGISGDPGAGNLLTFPTDNNFDKFDVGDVVQTGISIVAIDDTAPSITVSGGSWCGSNGSGNCGDGSSSGGDTYLENSWSGEGSVFVGLEGAIVLRNNNMEWVDDFYVTAPEQRIAARKVATNARKLNKK
jgi:hypothetical protein